ncbi:MAG: (2Fe-2S)-binding protein [Oscillatoriales cyanobacterium RM2_1_1]|nr:(2Fe-2S)-binding protein [Oscillatoriales cyanobacterium SM2_3_0]NJO45832.1 (2Fe-2S)-binding protein [Oscillatoriales cyanobacterium RM2_1_1]
MVKVYAQGKIIECDRGANLRRVLLDHGVNLYNNQASLINCHGIGTCGTCAVELEGDISELGWREQGRLSLPPHIGSSRRLACQVRVEGDVAVNKFNGFWGQGTEPMWTAAD